MPTMNPLVFLLGGLALLVATLTIAILNRRAVQADSPYDEAERRGDLSHVLWALRHADTLHRLGLDVGARFPQPTPERVGAALEGAGLGRVEVARSARRVEFIVRNGPNQGVPQVDEPLCYFTLGVLRGAFPPGKEYAEVVEESCHGTGMPYCVFRAEVTKPNVLARH